MPWKTMIALLTRIDTAPRIVGSGEAKCQTDNDGRNADIRVDIEREREREELECDFNSKVR